MVPYYIIMRLPGETQAEFFIMNPHVVPSRRDNMIVLGSQRAATHRTTAS